MGRLACKFYRPFQKKHQLWADEPVLVSNPATMHQYNGVTSEFAEFDMATCCRPFVAVEQYFEEKLGV